MERTETTTTKELQTPKKENPFFRVREILTELFRAGKITEERLPQMLATLEAYYAIDKGIEALRISSDHPDRKMIKKTLFTL